MKRLFVLIILVLVSAAGWFIHFGYIQSVFPLVLSSVFGFAIGFSSFLAIFYVISKQK